MIKVSKDDVQFMLIHLDLLPELLKLLQGCENEKLEITDDQADQLRDLCADKLPLVGFDENYVANDLGNKLEDLIDKLFIG